MSSLSNPLIEPLCYLSMAALSAVSHFDEKLIPLHIQIVVYSLSIIIIGAHRSLTQMLAEMKKGLLEGKREEGTIETVSNKDALQFPLYAGGMLVGLYALIKFFGKDVVNYVILVYIAIGGATGMKALLLSLTGDLFTSVDEKKVINTKLFGQEIVVT
jgi:minor histocompatibility antigen H13